ncbi:MAG: chorismate lyase [Tepidimonas taiwanensis]|nr:chorismate lyase [Tepidimonas taiwanensis]
MPPIVLAKPPADAATTAAEALAETLWLPAGPDLPCPPQLHPWLTDTGSLTARLQAHCQHLTVEVIAQGVREADADGATALQLPTDTRVWSRRVILRADGCAVVFAHSVTQAQHVRGAWHELPTLGNRPLGAMLFAAADVRRSPLSVAQLPSTHPLVQQALAVTGVGGGGPLWARRSLFWRAHAPLLVTEVFLPALLARVPSTAPRGDRP